MQRILKKKYGEKEEYVVFPINRSAISKERVKWKTLVRVGGGLQRYGSKQGQHASKQHAECHWRVRASPHLMSSSIMAGCPLAAAEDRATTQN